MVKTQNGRKPGPKHENVIKKLRHNRRMAAAYNRKQQQNEYVENNFEEESPICNEQQSNSSNVSNSFVRVVNRRNIRRNRNAPIVQQFSDSEDDTWSIEDRYDFNNNVVEDNGKQLVPYNGKFRALLDGHFGNVDLPKESVSNNQQNSAIPLSPFPVHQAEQYSFPKPLEVKYVQYADASTNIPEIVVLSEASSEDSENEGDYDSNEFKHLIDEIADDSDDELFDQLHLQKFIEELNIGLFNLFTFLSVANITTSIFFLLLLFNVSYFQFNHHKFGISSPNDNGTFESSTIDTVFFDECVSNGIFELALFEETVPICESDIPATVISVDDTSEYMDTVFFNNFVHVSSGKFELATYYGESDLIRQSVIPTVAKEEISPIPESSTVIPIEADASENFMEICPLFEKSMNVCTLFDEQKNETFTSTEKFENCTIENEIFSFFDSEDGCSFDMSEATLEFWIALFD